MILYRRLWLDFFKLPLDSLSKDLHVIDLEIRTRFFKWSWHEVYDFIEFVAQIIPVRWRTLMYAILQYCSWTGNVAYRFVDGVIAPITSEEEISAINDALAVKFSPVRPHLNSALEKLTDRKNPDYRNSIKESISAVEALVQTIT